jgi:hypothetical protein
MKEDIVKKTTVLFFAVSLMVSIASQASAYSWQTYNGHEYALTNNYSSWKEAEAEALKQGGHLVTINSEDENVWLSAKFKDSYAPAGPGNERFSAVLIGYYKDSDGKWKWISGEPVKYTNHTANDSYFDESRGGLHAYLHTDTHPDSKTWNASPSHTEDSSEPGFMFKGVIERPVPIPAAVWLLGSGLIGLIGVRRKFSK